MKPNEIGIRLESTSECGRETLLDRGVEVLIVISLHGLAGACARGDAWKEGCSKERGEEC